MLLRGLEYNVCLLSIQYMHLWKNVIAFSAALWGEGEWTHWDDRIGDFWSQDVADVGRTLDKCMDLYADIDDRHDIQKRAIDVTMRIL